MDYCSNMAFDTNKSFEVQLMDMTKAQINRLRLLLTDDIPARLSKGDMAAEVADYLCDESEFWMRMFPEDELMIMCHLANLQEGEPYITEYSGKPTLLEKLGIVFGISFDGESMVYNTNNDLRRAMKYGYRNAYLAFSCMNYSKYEQYARGYLKLYGICPRVQMANFLCAVSEVIEDNDWDKRRNPNAYLCESLMLRYHAIDINGMECFYASCFDIESISFDQVKSIEYGRYTMEEIFQAGNL